MIRRTIDRAALWLIRRLDHWHDHIEDTPDNPPPRRVFSYPLNKADPDA